MDFREARTAVSVLFGENVEQDPDRSSMTGLIIIEFRPKMKYDL